MKHIYYLIAVAFIIHELSWIFNPQQKVTDSKKLREESKKNKGRSWDEMTDDFKQLLKSRGLISLFFTIWMFAGLFTFNWFLFLSLLVFNFGIIAPIGKLFRYSTAYTVLHWINSVIGLAFGLFVIVNSYHLKIDVYQLFLSWINAI